jgi:hypothetical protein
MFAYFAQVTNSKTHHIVKKLKGMIHRTAWNEIKEQALQMAE